MPVESFAFFAFVASVVCELSLGYAPSIKINLLTTSTLATAIVLLTLAGRVAYFLLAVLMAALGGIMLYISGRYGDSDRQQAIRRHWLGNFFFRAAAAFFHATCIYTIPVAMVWSISDSFSNPDFFGLEIGHYVEGGLVVFMSMVALPMLVMPSGFETPTLDHQKYEGWVFFLVGTGVFTLWRTVHWLDGDDAKFGISGPSWDHELIAFIWGMSGLSALLLAHQGQYTNIHGVFPSAVLSWMLMHHVEGHEMNGWDDMAAMKVYAQIHQLYGMAMGAAALCRLINKPVEACFFFFVAAWSTPISTKWHSVFLTHTFTNPHFPEFPVYKVINTVTLASSAMLFAINVQTMGALRKLIDEDPKLMHFTPLKNTLGDCSDSQDSSTLLDSDSDEEAK